MAKSRQVLSTANKSRHVTRERRILFVVLSTILGLVAGLFCTELALRIAAGFYGFREGPDVVIRGSRILCLGDSNTYGVFYDASEAYPGQLQKQLDRTSGQAWRVINKGLPGMNSSQVVAQLDRELARYSPSHTVVSIGLNNYWNEAGSEGESAASLWLSDFRLYRLYRLLPSRPAQAEPDEFDAARPDLKRTKGEAGFTAFEDAATGRRLIHHRGDPDWSIPDRIARRRLRDDLEEIAAIARRRSTKLLLLTYAAFPLDDTSRPHHDSKFYRMSESMSEVMRQFGVENDVTVVDLKPRFQELLTGGAPRAWYFHNEAETHANPKGYREVASLVAEAITLETRLKRFDLVRMFQGASVDGTEARGPIHVRPVSIKGDLKFSIFQHPKSEVSFSPIVLGDNPRLLLAVGIDPGAWQEPGDGVLFEVRILSEEGRSSLLYSRYVDAKNEINDQAWADEEIDLSEHSGREIVLTLHTSFGPSGNSFFDWAAWGRLEVVTTFPSVHLH